MKPILFNTDMVRAILGNRKTVTRRVVRPQHLRVLDSTYRKEHPETPDKVLLDRLCEPPYRPGDILYVREAWCWCPCWDCGMNLEEGCCDDTADKFYHPQKLEWGCYGYKASFAECEAPFGDGWRPSIHMPREAARIFLRVTDVRVERLQEITEEQARAEGVEPIMITTDVGKPDAEKEWHEWGPALPGFIGLWGSTIKEADLALYGWGANPWVWVIGFERISREEAGADGLQRAD